MRLALGIAAFWLGMTAMYVAFHGLSGAVSTFEQGVEAIPDTFRDVLRGYAHSKVQNASWLATDRPAANEPVSYFGTPVTGGSGTAGGTQNA